MKRIIRITACALGLCMILGTASVSAAPASGFWRKKDSQEQQNPTTPAPAPTTTPEEPTEGSFVLI